MTTLYLNRSFSATSFVLHDLRAKWTHDPLRIVMSHSKIDPYLAECVDHLEVEPRFDFVSEEGREAYVSYLLEQCRKHEVNYMLPRYQATIIAAARDRFKAQGVSLILVGDAEVYQLFDDKFRAGQTLETLGLIPSPRCALVSSYYGFQEVYHELRHTPLNDSAEREQVCLKPNVGVGGKGFMRIAHHRSELEDLFRESVHSISFARLDRALSHADPFPKLLLSTYLSGVEYSIDCIADHGTLLAAYPRVYLNKYEQRFDHRPELIKLCRDVCAHFKLNALFNLQVKEHRGVWYFIELNTRMAAGAHRITTLGVSPLKHALELESRRPLSGSLDIKWGSVVRRQEIYIPDDK